MTSLIPHLKSRGATISDHMQAWLLNVDVVLKGMNEEEQMRYQQYIIQVVEDIHKKWGIAAHNWGKQPVLQNVPRGETLRHPGSFRFDAPSSQPQGMTAFQVDHRALLHQDCRLKAPSYLAAHVQKALQKLDEDVERGKRQYSDVKCEHVMKVAKMMQDAEFRAQQAPPSPYPMQYASSGPVPPLGPSPGMPQHSAVPPLGYHHGAPPQQQPHRVPTPAGGGSSYGKPQISLSSLGLGSKKSTPATSIDKRPSRRADSEDSNDSMQELINVAGGKRKRMTEEELRRAERFASSSHDEPPSKRKTLKRQKLKDVSAVSTPDFFATMARSGTDGAAKKWLVGKSEALERMYSRYEPTSDDIRPQSFLPKAFAHIRCEARTRGNKFLFDQLKGMRQDLVVQNIRTSFTVRVYEEHARVCLELSNLSEFNQCQAALKTFYKEGLQSNDGDNLIEFLVYRLIYLVLSDQEDTLALELKDLELLCSPESRLSMNMPPANLERFIHAAKSKEIMLAMRFCSYIQQSDCLKAFKIALLLGKGVKQLFGGYLQRRRVLTVRDISIPAKGKVPSTFLLSSLGLLPSSSPFELLRKPEDKKLEEEISLVSTFVKKPKNNVESLSFLEADSAATIEAFTSLLKEIKIEIDSSFSHQKEFKIAMNKRLQFLSPDKCSDFDSKNTALIETETLTKAIIDYCNFISNRTNNSGPTE